MRMKLFPRAGGARTGAMFIRVASARSGVPLATASSPVHACRRGNDSDDSGHCHSPWLASGFPFCFVPRLAQWDGEAVGMGTQHTPDARNAWSVEPHSISALPGSAARGVGDGGTDVQERTAPWGCLIGLSRRRRRRVACGRPAHRPTGILPFAADFAFVSGFAIISDFAFVSDSAFVSGQTPKPSDWVAATVAVVAVLRAPIAISATRSRRRESGGWRRSGGDDRDG